MGLSGMSPLSLLLILLIICVLFGTRHLKSIGQDLGHAIRQFKHALRQDENDLS